MNTIFNLNEIFSRAATHARAAHCWSNLRCLSAVALVVLGCAASATRAQDANAAYRSTSRDPFTKVKVVVRRPPVKKVAPKPTAPPAPQVVVAPLLQQRIDSYKALKVAAMNAQQPAPKPVTALLLNEVQVVGIFRTPRGYAAMIEATPINLSYVIYPGERFFDGQLVAVEENRLVFRREQLWSNGKRDLSVETKPLRPTNAVTNEMNQPRSAQNAEAPSAANAVAGVGAATPNSPK